MFDNTHFTRDNPNVPSDLEQMPSLLNFITHNGTLVSHEHTPIIAHTGTDILSHLTGLYGDAMGQPISNGFGFYDTDSFASFRSSFNYWTDRLGGKNDNTYFMLTKAGKNAPAPWVPFTRAGCDVGAVGSANQVLENTRFDVPTVFGPGSSEDIAQQTAFNIPCGFGANPPCTPTQQKQKNQPQADFVGIAVHCAKSSAVCAGAQGIQPEKLPDEPGGYSGYSGLFGAKYVDPRISSGGVRDLNGNLVTDGTGNPGFPGFDAMSASTSLGFVANMLEKGIPVTYAYISDAHDNHATGHAFGPGEAGYVQQLKAYDQAFASFFARLASDGITPANTLFQFTSDEGDHFTGIAPSPPRCDGVTTPCTYKQIGELDGNLAGMLSTVPPCSTGTPVPSGSVHNDSAPTVYLDTNPGQADPLTRNEERAAGHITATNPITGEVDHVTNYLAGTPEMRILHMITGDSRRDPTYTLFARPDYYLCYTGFACTDPTTGKTFVGNKVVEEPAFAWNHGDVSPDINTTWLGIAGPGVRHLGVDATTWSDHTDDRPTTLALLGLHDDYAHDGRVLVEVIDRHALPGDIGDPNAYAALGRVFKQLDASVGQLGLATLVASTRSLESGDATNDTEFTNTATALGNIESQRNALTTSMTRLLDAATGPHESDGVQRDSAADLGNQGFQLLQRAWELAGV